MEGEDDYMLPLPPDSPPPSPPSTTALVHLDPEHLRVLKNALSCIIATKRADDNFAQLIDGIQTRSTFEEHFQDPPGLESVLSREKPSEESVELVRAFRQELDISSLQLDLKIVQSYQNAPPGSWQFELRLLTLAAVAVHVLAGMVYHINHPDAILHPTRSDPGNYRSTFQPPHYMLDFYHTAYNLYREYPYGMLNLIGYWMETRIFGGVLLVEHDDSECEAKNIFVHAQSSMFRDSPQPNIFQLSESQVHMFSRPFYIESGMKPTEVGDILPFKPENGARSLHRNDLQPFHVFRDEFSRIKPWSPTSVSCVVPMTDEYKDLIKRGLELSGEAHRIPNLHGEDEHGNWS